MKTMLFRLILSRTIFGILLIFPLVITSCKPIEHSRNVPEVDIRFSRSGCFGYCPAYEVVISGNGALQYEGFNYVQVKGIVESSITSDELKSLISAFENINFFDLEEIYSAPMTDGPTYKTTLRLNGKEKTVSRYVCGPKQLVDLEYLIDEIVGTEKWIGAALEKWYPPEPLCSRHRNTFNSPLKSPLKTP